MIQISINIDLIHGFQKSTLCAYKFIKSIKNRPDIGAFHIHLIELFHQGIAPTCDAKSMVYKIRNVCKYLPQKIIFLVLRAYIELIQFISNLIHFLVLVLFAIFAGHFLLGVGIFLIFARLFAGASIAVVFVVLFTLIVVEFAFGADDGLGFFKSFLPSWGIWNVPIVWLAMKKFGNGVGILLSELANLMASNSGFSCSSAKSASTLQTQARSLPQLGLSSIQGATKWLAQTFKVLSRRMTTRTVWSMVCLRSLTSPVPRSFHSAGLLDVS